MIYPEYHALKQRYKEAMQRVDDIIQEQEELFQRTQPSAIRYDAEKVKSSNMPNLLDDYVIEKEQRHIVERLAEAHRILDERKALLKEKETELRDSKHIADVVYCCRYIDRMRIRKIRRITNYSDAQIYRILDGIRKELDNDQSKDN